jgi:hypothetical protein
MECDSFSSFMRFHHNASHETGLVKGLNFFTKVANHNLRYAVAAYYNF